MFPTRWQRAASRKNGGLLRIVPAVVFLALLPQPAFAVQVHGGPEGLYVHMMAHVFFSAALVYLLCILRRRPPDGSRGWTFFRYSLYLFFLWNLDTFMVHWLSSRLPDEALAESGPIWGHHLNSPLTFERLMYYFGRFEHLLSVPAVFFLVLSLRAFCRQAEQGRSDPGAP
ncbi:MAG: hypothetical protein M0017_03575 [Desulfobacteraceae bacterium]|nr:hypothetical protein [Desulfobacteraceae bacterium]